MRLVLGTSASQFESEVAYHLYARVVQLADTAVSKTVSSPFESEREYQLKKLPIADCQFPIGLWRTGT